MNEFRNTDVIKAVRVIAVASVSAVDKLGVLEPFKLSSEPLEMTSSVESITDTAAAALSIEATSIDLGKVEVGDRKECYFTAKNSSPVPLRFQVLDDEGLPYEITSDILDPFESRRVYVHVQPSKHGSQSRGFHCRTESACLYVLFSFLGVYRQYLSIEGADISADNLSFGECFIDSSRRYSKAIPCTVKNVTDVEVFISASSNLSQQCLIFFDETLTQPAQEFILLPDQAVVLFVVLQPYISQNQQSSVSAPVSAPLLNITSLNVEQDIIPFSVESRDLIGGVKFQIATGDPVHRFAAASQVMKFSSLIGYSSYGISNKLIDFGNVEGEDAELSGYFWVQNLSKRLPLALELFPSSPDIAVEPSTILLKGWGSVSSVIDPGSRQRLEVIYRPKSRGYLVETIKIVNKNNSQHVDSVEIRAFIDDHTLELQQVEPPRPLELPLQKFAIAIDTLYCYTASESDRLVSYVKHTKKDDVCIELQNRGGRAVCFKCQTPLPLSICVRPPLLDTVDGASESFGLDKSASLQLSIRPKESFTLSETQFVDFQAGKKLKLSGDIALLDCDSNRIVKAFPVEFIIISSRLSTDIDAIDLGKTGYLNGWKDVPFSFTVLNNSDIPLFYELRHSDCIDLVSIEGDTQYLGSSKCKVKERGKHFIEAVYKPKKAVLSAPNQVIEIFNLNNPKNSVNVAINSQVTTFDLKFDRLSEGEIQLPPLYHPYVANSPVCENWFIISNTSDSETKIEILSEASPDVQDYVELEAISRASNLPLFGVVTLEPKSSMEIKVRAIAKTDARLPLSSNYLTNEEGITFGSLSVLNRKQGLSVPLSETMPIRGRIVESQIFAISHRKVDFAAHQEADDDGIFSVPDPELPTSTTTASVIQKIKLSNLSGSFSFHFQVSVDLPPELSSVSKVLRIYPLDEQNGGEIPPMGSLILNLELVDFGIKGLSEDIKLRILDKNSLNRHFSTVFVGIRDSVGANSFSASLSTPRESLGRRALPSAPLDRLTLEDTPINVPRKLFDGPCITLKGCKRMSDSWELYELDFGQQDMGSSAVTKKLLLENYSSLRIHFSLKNLTPFDRTWLSASVSDGVLESVKGSDESSAQTITLTISTEDRGVYSTYVTVENLDNPRDIKVVRVSVEVVSKQNVKRMAVGTLTSMPLAPNESWLNHAFDVLVYGSEAGPRGIEMDNLFFHYEYSARSFIIVNREPVPLEISVKVKQEHDDKSHLALSLARTSLKLFRSLILEPESRLRIYLHLMPLPSDRVVPPSTFSESELMVEKNAELHFNCRLIRDYQKILPIRSLCRYPQFTTSSQSFALRSELAQDGDNWNIRSIESRTQFTVTNHLNEPLELEIFNDSDFLLVDSMSSVERLSRSTISIEPRSSKTIHVELDQDCILRNAEMCRKVCPFLVPESLKMQEKYFIDHLTVYNKRRLSERQYIKFKITFGVATNFQVGIISI